VTVEQSTPKKSSSRRIQLVLLVVVFLAPIGAAIFYQPSSFNNRGDLVEPPRPIGAVTFLDSQSAPVSMETLLGKWTYFYFASDECGLDCRELAETLERVRLTRGKHMRRVRTFLVTGDLESVPRLAGDVAAFPGVAVFGISPEELASLRKTFTLEGKAPLDGESRIYLVDPLGNLMMSYRRDADPTDIRKDLARLLRVSRIG
jgi:cytochrome oxidase Cu insertion factor (SCO1/SenC/PrrC family)